jgi:hypothetical protein
MQPHRQTSKYFLWHFSVAPLTIGFLTGPTDGRHSANKRPKVSKPKMSDFLNLLTLLQRRPTADRVGPSCVPVARRRGDRQQEVVEFNSKVPVHDERNKKEESQEAKPDPCALKVIGRISHLDQDGPVAAPRRGWAASAFTFASANAGSSLYETVRTSNEVFPLWLLSSTCGYMGWRKYRT